MKLEWVNKGEDFEIPKMKNRHELALLDYLEANTKEKDSIRKKNEMEYIEAVFLVLHDVDKNVTRDMVLDNLSFDELFAVYLAIRMRGNKTYCCPSCKKSVSIWELIAESNKQEGETNFHEAKKDTTEMKKET
jgi:uncharacterized protein YlaI